MAKTPKIRLIRERWRDIEKEMERLKAQIAQLETQAAELKIAERVLVSLSADDDDDEGEATNGAPRSYVLFTDGDQIKTVRKPDNVPTMPDMITQALENVRSTGRGLEPKEMTEYIGKRFWPEVPANSVGPIAWRMVKQGRLIKKGTRYYLPSPDQRSS